jgi:hypothetical protein
MKTALSRILALGASCAHNPTLTAQGLAWRTAEHLSKKWKRIAN